MPQEGSKIGRPTKYKPEYDTVVYQLCLLGFTDAQLAEHFEINEDTLYEWKKKHPNFSDSLKSGKAIADGQVAMALHKRAVGFSYQETTFEKIVNDDTAKDTIETNLYRKKVITKTIAPDTGAAMNWLKNRQKDLWRDNYEIDFNKLSDSQLDTIIEKLTKQANNQ